MKKVLVGFLSIFIILSSISLYNTFNNKPFANKNKVVLDPLPTDAIAHMGQAIQISTETPDDNYKYDSAIFYKYRQWMDLTYPTVKARLPRTIIDSFNYIYEWKGTDTSLLPIVLMAHYDVVPVEASAVKLWHAKPYGGEVKDGYIWGRGALDDKASMISILEATEQLLKTSFQPKQTILLCFGSDEESNGRGALAMVKYFKNQKMRFDLVVDEGGEISTEDMKDVKHPIASIGVGEKGYVTLVLTAQKEGGHSSIPGKTSSIDLLSKAIYKLREKEMPAKIIPPIKAYLTRTSAYTENFWKKISLSNLWLFEKWVLNDMSEAPASNALIRTTIVPTVFNSGVRDNVIPTFATAYVNSRILPGETQQDVFNFVTKAINDTQIKVTYYPNYSTLPSSTTDINSSAFKKLEKAINGTIEDVVVAPVIMVGATDSRSYRDLSDGVVNFSPLTNAKGYHGIDERLLITDLQKGIHYYTLLIKGEK